MYSSFPADPSSPRRRKILVAVDATKDQLSSEALVWALQHIAQPGDSLRLLGILHQVKNAPISVKLGYKSRVEQGIFGVNDKKQQDEIQKMFLGNGEYFKELTSLCGNKKVDLSTAIIPGFPARAVLLLDVNNFNPTWVVLDRFMKKEKKYLWEQLQCSLVVMDKYGKGQVKKLVTPMEDGSDLFELDCPLDLNFSCNSCLDAAATETSCTSVEFSGNTSFDESIKPSPSSSPAKIASPVNAVVDHKPPSKATSSMELNKLELEEHDHISPAVSGDDFFTESFTGPGKSFGGMQMFSPDVPESHLPPQLSRRQDLPFATNQASVTPISVRPVRASEMELLQLLGGVNELETELFESYIEVSDNPTVNQEPARTPSIRPSSSVDKLDRYYSVDENHGLGQGGTPLCSQCNNKSPRFGTQPTVFPYSQIEEATSGFSKDHLLAEGGFGFVFKGVLPDGQLIAVKQHKLASRQGDREFRAEVEVLSCAQHRNLVTLIGYCNEGSRRILVYEYVCNGSLNWHLSPKNPKPLDWPARQKIALGAARGLRYLHEECRIGCIVHRDVRPNNILVTHDFTALVGDFGLARWQARGDTAEQTRVIGTVGYVAPEYAETGQITEKADVYSFGLVLLEIITGFPAFDSYRQPGQQHLPDWASPLLAARASHELLDKRIDESTVDEYELINMVTTASLCIQKDPNKRPKMSQVVRHLEGDDRESTPLSPIDLEIPSISSARLSSFRSSSARPSSARPPSARPSSAAAKEKKIVSVSTVSEKLRPKKRKEEARKRPISYDEML